MIAMRQIIYKFIYYVGYYYYLGRNQIRAWLSPCITTFKWTSRSDVVHFYTVKKLISWC